MKNIRRILFCILFLLCITGCVQTVQPLNITNGEKIELVVGESIDLEYELNLDVTEEALWTASNSCCVVDEEGVVIPPRPPKREKKEEE